MSPAPSQLQCVFLCVVKYVKVHGRQKKLGVLHDQSLPYSKAGSLTGSGNRMGTRAPPWSCCYHLPSQCWSSRCMQPCPDFYVVAKNQIQIFMLAQKVPIPTKPCLQAPHCRSFFFIYLSLQILKCPCFRPYIRAKFFHKNVCTLFPTLCKIIQWYLNWPMKNTTNYWRGLVP